MLRHRSAQLMLGQLRGVTAARFLFGITGGIVFPLALLGFPAHAALLAFGALVFSIVGELLERCLFFTAVVFPKMPGGGA